MSYISPSLNFLITTVKKVGNALTRDINEIEQLQSSVRGPKEFAASAADRVAKGLKVELQKGKPAYAFVTDGMPRPAAPHFLVAPIDGIVNFSHGIPYFAISVAVVENDVITAAVVYNPATSDLYFAEKGNGAYREGFRNHERLRVSARKEVADALVGIDKSVELPVEFENFRQLGSVSMDMAYVAAGRLDALISKGNSAAVMAAGMLLVKEAGGYVYELNQKDIRTENLNLALDSGNVIAANSNMGKKVYDLLNK